LEKGNLKEYRELITENIAVVDILSPIINNNWTHNCRPFEADMSIESLTFCSVPHSVCGSGRRNGTHIPTSRINFKIKSSGSHDAGGRYPEDHSTSNT